MMNTMNDKAQFLLEFCLELKEFALILLDENGNIVAWNKGAHLMKGYSAEEIIGQHFSQLYLPEAKAVGHPERELAVAAEVGHYEEQGWRMRKDGTRFWAHVAIRALYDEDHVLSGFGKVTNDYTSQKQLAEQSANVIRLLEFMSTTDYLTGLHNRRSLDQHLARELSGARRHGRSVSVGMADFDLFKAYNDEFGHQAGDAYLKLGASRWREALRPEDVLARYGGDEFVVILPDTSLEDAATPLERLRAATPGPLTCSVGVAEWDGLETQQQLIDRADQALYQAKAAGRDRQHLSPRPTSSPAAPLEAQRDETRKLTA